MKVLRRVLDEKGLTLVEMMVSLVMLTILMTMCAAALPSAARAVQRLESLSQAQVVLDATLESLSAELSYAEDYIKLYDHTVGGSVAGVTGQAAAGNLVEFKNDTNHIVLLGANGCGETTILTAAGQQEDIRDPVPAGVATERFYSAFNGAGEYYYQTKTGVLIARGLQTLHPEKFYMGYFFDMKVEVLTQAGNAVQSIKLTGSLYRDAAHTDLAVRDTRVVDLRYEPVLKTDVTAKAKTT